MCVCVIHRINHSRTNTDMVYSFLVCDHSTARIVGSNPAEGMDVCLLCLYHCVVLCCIGSNLYAKLVICSEES